MAPQPAAWTLRLASDVTSALLVSSVAHRLRLAAVLERALARGATTEGVAVLTPWRLAWADLLLAALAGLVVLALGAGRPARLRRRVLWASCAVALLVVGLVRTTHLSILTPLRTGLTWRVLADALQSGEGLAAARETPTTALLAALWPPAAFGVFQLLRGRLVRVGHGVTLAAAAVATLLGMSAGAAVVDGFPEEAPWPPVGFIAVDIGRHLLADGPDPAFADDAPDDDSDDAPDDDSDGSPKGSDDDDDDPSDGVAPGPGKAPRDGAHGSAPAAPRTSGATSSAPPSSRGAPPGHIGAVPTPSEMAAATSAKGRQLARVGLRIADPRVIAPTPVPWSAPSGRRPVNLVWVIMESTGTRYATGKTYPTRPPMPYLQELARTGWHLRQHRSNSNSSATSIVAQMSGLLPMPSLRMMSVKQNNFLRGLPAFLPGWDQFLVTPGKLTYFFPRAFFQHNGLDELWGFRALPNKRIVAEDRLARDEIATVDFFLQRLARAKEPFLGIYYSYMPHWEYTDYGKDWRRYRGRRLIDHYHNGLWLLDHQLKRIVDGVKAKGALDRTLFVFVGDHGEAFGQHKRNWAHAKGSWDENLQTPAVLWSPALLGPRTVDWPTTHIDLLPTVLDLLGRPYEPRLFQGESLLQRSLRRRVSLHWGNEGTVTAIHTDGTKVQLSLTERWCRAYSLDRDPRERRPGPCKTPRRKALRAVLRAWVRTQRPLLQRYSDRVKQGLPFEGWSHPR